MSLLCKRERERERGEREKQIKANAVYRYKRWGCKPKLNLKNINTSYNS